MCPNRIKILDFCYRVPFLLPFFLSIFENFDVKMAHMIRDPLNWTVLYMFFYQRTNFNKWPLILFLFFYDCLLSLARYWTRNSNLKRSLRTYGILWALVFEFIILKPDKWIKSHNRKSKTFTSYKNAKNQYPWGK